MKDSARQLFILLYVLPGRLELATRSQSRCCTSFGSLEPEKTFEVPGSQPEAQERELLVFA